MRSRWVLALGGAVGAVAFVLGWLVLTSWSVDAGGLACGSPLDNPGWTTGSTCHGAVNRRTGVGWMLVIGGVALPTAVVVLHLDARRRA